MCTQLPTPFILFLKPRAHRKLLGPQTLVCSLYSLHPLAHHNEQAMWQHYRNVKSWTSPMSPFWAPYYFFRGIISVVLQFVGVVEYSNSGVPASVLFVWGFLLIVISTSTILLALERTPGRMSSKQCL